MRIGVISDTHGLLRPEVFDVFARVDHILHAGDRQLRASGDDGLHRTSRRCGRDQTRSQIHGGGRLIGVDDAHQLIQNNTQPSTHTIRLSSLPRSPVKGAVRAARMSAFPQNPPTAAPADHA